MNESADLEISLRRGTAQAYEVELRFSPPGIDGDVRLLRDGPAEARFDFQALRTHDVEPDRYGGLLTETLFTDRVKNAFELACVSAQVLNVPLRLRLFIDSQASELHALRWETMLDPRDGAPLCTKEGILYSRYLASDDWQSDRLRPWHQLRALVAIADPADLPEYQPEGLPLAPISGDRELAAVDHGLSRASDGLAPLPITPLVTRGEVTLDQLMHHLRDGYDVLYLLCHGALVRKQPGTWLERPDGQTDLAHGQEEEQPYLWLERPDGTADVVRGEDIVVRLRELQHRPRLVILASCQSAGVGETARTADGEALKALGPRLAQMGIPAVLAMQGQISTSAVAEFMAEFFLELRRDQQIDRAVSVARRAIREPTERWKPVLFMRLKSGQIGHYTPRFASDDGEEFPHLVDLLDAIRYGSCTPILGPGLTEALLGSSREIARRWAETYRFPLALHDREDLPQVAQFVAILRQHWFLRRELLSAVRRAILDRYGGRERPGFPLDDLQRKSLPDLVRIVGDWLRTEEPLEPHRVLAALPCPIYVTTNADGLMADALRAAGRTPDARVFPRDSRPEPSRVDLVQKPTRDHPLVYHLFGCLDQPETLVITEDDYFDYLIQWNRSRELIPPEVRGSLVKTSLLFLGFQMDDWSFRAFYRSIVNQEGSPLSDRNVHVAVQVDPEEARITDPDQARRYVQQYFQGYRISVYWGRVNDFVRDLRDCWNQRCKSDPDWQHENKIP